MPFYWLYSNFFQFAFLAILQKQQQKDDFVQLDNIPIYLSAIYYWMYCGKINKS